MSNTSERSPYLREAAINRIIGWAQTQLDAWRDTSVKTPGAYKEQLERLEANSPFVFLFDFDKGSVCLRAKTSSSVRFEAAAPELIRRAHLYLELFRDVLAGFHLQYSFSLAIDVDDHPLDTYGAPVFAFQKRTGSPLILLPDVDILAADYFISPEFDDPLDFDAKADAAIFVGATTGYDLTREVVETLAMPRLRSAVYFREAEDVIFHLPKIVQYDTEETADMVRALGVSGSPASWVDQFGYRYLLSMDGNGATCSRVAIALKSRSVLIKYASDFQLFYFDGLVAGENFLGVSQDEDVHRVLAWCREHPDRTSEIASEGRRFACEHLSRLPVLIYVASLLDAYSRTVFRQVQQDPADIGGHRTVVDAYAHIQNRGDTRPILGGWLGSVDGQSVLEGFVLEPGPGVNPMDISYQAILFDGSLSKPCHGFQFCGTRGQNRGLRGVRAAFVGAAEADYELSYEATFADGLRIGPAPAGLMCSSPHEAELTGLRLTASARAAHSRAARFGR